MGTATTPARTLTWMDHRIIEGAAPQMAAILSGMTLDELAICVAKGTDLADLMPPYQDVPGYARGALRQRLEAAGDALYDALLEQTRNLLRPTHPAHAALLGREKGAAWYRAHMIRMRDTILAQMGA